MNYQTVLWILFGVLLITLQIVRKRNNKRLNTILWSLLVLIFLGQELLPRQFFGKWNSISRLNGKKVTKILLYPSQPNWEVNLTGKEFVISDVNQIGILTNLLENVEVYSPGHPSRIWETKMTVICLKDSFVIEIHQTENNGTVVYTPTNDWRKDEIGTYLEKITTYIKPVYSDTSSVKF